ncbi:DUF654-domain-containing protein [Coniophora puteana RWD-64-598 SS2]|uniref:DUF654-domain-containing protein n=1 Tax=Coniophora puteana (strain RWD-64-598) TaxID=741705 RepID=A0A5M3MRF1_CONPW|nr:DUF654-domain-containing protein [Coniophora puteana RWD-64-598 SS2]EIW81729.1 DUF654-domain-containing protein [Coniophora puteana RWD-64-598 SS2]
MPPRLNKRQAREQEELQALGLAEQEASNEEVSEVEEPAMKPQSRATGFAALLDQDGNDREEDEEEEEEEHMDQTKPSKKKQSKKKKKKAPARTPVIDDAEPSTESPVGSAGKSTPTAAGKKSKAKQKSKGKDKPAEDDIDKALAELSAKTPSSTAQPLTRTSHSTLSSLLAPHLAISPQHLDPTAELRKFFGSKVLSAVSASSSDASTSRAGARGKRGGGGRETALRSVLTRPPAIWARYKPREGLSVRPLDGEEVGKKTGGVNAGERWYTVEYSKGYKTKTKAFVDSVMMGDPDAMWMIYRDFPWQADTLLQLAELQRHREDFARAVELTDQALFAYERAFTGRFSLLSGSNRLDFDYVESRPFYLALHRQAFDLVRRGCLRTAFEFTKLLWSLDPWSDPHGALLHLDFLAVRANMGDWLLDVYDAYASMYAKSKAQDKDKTDRVDPSVLPGWMYARSLAIRVREGGKENTKGGGGGSVSSTEALREAIIAFPSVVPVLADKADVSLSGELRSHPAFRLHTDESGLSSPQAALHLLSHLYATRSANLWKEPEVASWFRETANSMLSKFTARTSPHDTSNPTRARFLKIYTSPLLISSLYRHVLVLSMQSLLPFMRTALNSQASTHLACDPLPPPTARTTYDQSFFADVAAAAARASLSTDYTRPATRREERLLERAMPDRNMREQLLALYDRHPREIGAMFGGRLGWVQRVADMGEEGMGLVDMIVGMEEQGFAGGRLGLAGNVPPVMGQRGMPGGFEMPLEIPEEGIEIPVRFEMGSDDEDGDERDGAGVVREYEGEVEDEPTGPVDEDDSEDEDEEPVGAPMPLRVMRNFLTRLWGGAPPPEDEDDDEEDEVDDDPGH